MDVSKVFEDGRAMLASDQIINKTPNYVSRFIGQEVVIILPALGEVKVLNEVGARIWELSDGTRTIADLVDHICEEFAVDHQQAEMDAVDFIQKMIERKMLVISG
jgi:hypothetical protein